VHGWIPSADVVWIAPGAWSAPVFMIKHSFEHVPKNSLQVMAVTRK